MQPSPRVCVVVTPQTPLAGYARARRPAGLSVSCYSPLGSVLSPPRTNPEPSEREGLVSTCHPERSEGSALELSSRAKRGICSSSCHHERSEGSRSWQFALFSTFSSDVDFPPA